MSNADPDIARAEHRLTGARAEPLRRVIDERSTVGEPAECMSLPDIPQEMFGEPVPVNRKVLFCFTDRGYDYDINLARQYLAPGHIYTAMAITVGSCSSVVELAEFPGIRFNTIMFIDWPAVGGES